MPNTYTQIHIHIVFIVQNRASIIRDHWKDELYKYISGIIKAHNHKLMVINGMPDHMHLLIGLKPHQSISKLVQQIKGSSSKWINRRRLVHGKFSWQAGFGAFSCGASDLKRIIAYINNQEAHHRKTSFLEEYRSLLKEFNIQYHENYIFKDID